MGDRRSGTGCALVSRALWITVYVVNNGLVTWLHAVPAGRPQALVGHRVPARDGAAFSLYFVVADLGIRYVFAAFAVRALVGGLVTMRFTVETKGRVFEELSP